MRLVHLAALAALCLAPACVSSSREPGSGAWS